MAHQRIFYERMKLTKQIVDLATAPASGQRFIRDTLMQGFALRITASGVKSFVVEKRIHGKMRRKTLGRYGVLTVEEARKAAQKFLGKVADNRDPVAEQRDEDSQRVTLREVFEAYLKARSGLKARTQKDYRYIMEFSFSDWLERPMRDITKDRVAQRHARLGKASHARANNSMRVLRALFNFAAGQYEDSQGRSFFPENPVKRLSHARAWYRIERRQTVIKRSELPAWFEAVQTLKHDPTDSRACNGADLLLLFLFTGLRRSEGMTLKWEAVDLEERTLTIGDTKNRIPLVLPLSDFLVDMLTQRKREATGEYVFPGQDGEGHIVEPRPQMDKITAITGKRFTLHDLRRTFITVAESLDIPMFAIKRLVNHKMGDDVTAGYIISDVERLRAPMQKITDFLVSASNTNQESKVVYLRTGPTGD